MTLRKWYPAVATVAALALSVVAYPRLTGPIPIHWGLDGTPNGWAGRTYGAFAIPFVMASLALMFAVLPDVDPRRDNYEKFWGSYTTIVTAIMTFCLAVHCLSLGAALGIPVPMNRVAPAITGGLFLCIGNVFPRVRSNSWIGLRTPSTMGDDQNWTRTHKLAGYLFVLSGVLMLADSAVPGYWMNRIAIGSVIAAAVATVVFSAAISLTSD